MDGEQKSKTYLNVDLLTRSGIRFGIDGGLRILWSLVSHNEAYLGRNRTDASKRSQA